MVRGRKPRAIEVQRAAGSFVANPDREPASEVIGDPRAPIEPDFIASNDVAHKIWQETTGALEASGILSMTDTHLLTTYCFMYSDFIRLAKRIELDGHEDANGKTSPQSVAFFKTIAQLGKLQSELGLSPSSRARLSSIKPEDAGGAGSLASIISAMKN